MSKVGIGKNEEIISIGSVLFVVGGILISKGIGELVGGELVGGM
ncbi:hypothetical protein [Staphylococcus epidermidis]|nr:hypothetical protein [Staphylococcus epidermidis]